MMMMMMMITMIMMIPMTNEPMCVFVFFLQANIPPEIVSKNILKSCWNTSKAFPDAYMFLFTEDTAEAGCFLRDSTS